MPGRRPARVRIEHGTRCPAETEDTTIDVKKNLSDQEQQSPLSILRQSCLRFAFRLEREDNKKLSGMHMIGIGDVVE